jgi:hypothetical protein
LELWSTWRLEQLPISGGMLPVRLLEAKDREVRAERPGIWAGTGPVRLREDQERDPGLALPCSASDPGPATRAGVLVARIVLSPIGSQVWATTLPGEEDRFVLAQSTIVLECQQLCSEAIHVLQISHSTWKPRRGRPTCMHHSKTLQSRSKKRIDTAIFSALLST